MRRGTIRVTEDGLYEASIHSCWRGKESRISGGWSTRQEAEVWLRKYGVYKSQTTYLGMGLDAENRTETIRTT
jgi:hypothetical protein